VGLSKPPKLFSKVDFPLPEGPSKTTSSPRKRSRSTPERACTAASPSPYVFVNCRTVKTGSCNASERRRVRGPADMTGAYEAPIGSTPQCAKQNWRRSNRTECGFEAHSLSMTMQVTCRGVLPRHVCSRARSCAASAQPTPVGHSITELFPDPLLSKRALNSQRTPVSVRRVR